MPVEMRDTKTTMMTTTLSPVASAIVSLVTRKLIRYRAAILTLPLRVTWIRARVFKFRSTAASELGMDIDLLQQHTIHSFSYTASLYSLHLLSTINPALYTLNSTLYTPHSALWHTPAPNRTLSHSLRIPPLIGGLINWIALSTDVRF